MIPHPDPVQQDPPKAKKTSKRIEIAVAIVVIMVCFGVLMYVSEIVTEAMSYSQSGIIPPISFGNILTSLITLGIVGAIVCIITFLVMMPCAGPRR